MFILCSYYIVYHVPRACLVSCHLLKNPTILESFVSFSGSLKQTRDKVLFTRLDHLVFYYLFSYVSLSMQCFSFHAFLPQQDFANCRYSANLKILKAKVNSFFGTVLLELLNDVIFFHHNIL